MFKRNSPEPYLLLIIILALLFTLLSYTVNAAQQTYPEVSARAAVLYQPDTRTFLFKKNENMRLPMASTTKIMTALLAIENSDPKDKVKIPREAVGTEGSSAYLKEGETLSMEELLYALLLQSANDAAVAIAIHISGSVEAFADLMNERADSLGLSDTHFKNPHGLNEEEHFTTAKDLAIISAVALCEPLFEKITSTYKKSFISEDRRRIYVNHNKLLKSYDGAIGIKTGFTKKSGRCLVGASERGGLRFITVTLDAPSDWNDHKRLFDYGYEALERITLCKKGEISYDLPLVSGKSDSVRVENKEELSVILKKGENLIEKEVRLKRYLIAPTKRNEEVGEVIFKLDGKCVGSVKLYPTENINKKEEKGFLKRLFGN